jgi:hypothetical protein
MRKDLIIALAIAIVFTIVASWYWYWRVHFAKDEFSNSYEIEKGIYEEVFILSRGGVLANDLYACYLTDSVNFRKYVDRFDNKEKYRFYKVDKNTIMAVKYSFRVDYKSFLPIDSTFYSINFLKEENDFD